MDYGMSSFTLNTCKGGFLQLLGISSELCIFILIILIKPFWSLVDHIRTRPKTNLELGVIIVQHSLYGCSAFVDILYLLTYLFLASIIIQSYKTVPKVKSQEYRENVSDFMSFHDEVVPICLFRLHFDTSSMYVSQHKYCSKSIFCMNKFRFEHWKFHQSFVQTRIENFHKDKYNFWSIQQFSSIITLFTDVRKYKANSSATSTFSFAAQS